MSHNEREDNIIFEEDICLFRRLYCLCSHFQEIPGKSERKVRNLTHSRPSEENGHLITFAS